MLKRIKELKGTIGTDRLSEKKMKNWRKSYQQHIIHTVPKDLILPSFVINVLLKWTRLVNHQRYMMNKYMCVLLRNKTQE